MSTECWNLIPWYILDSGSASAIHWVAFDAWIRQFLLEISWGVELTNVTRGFCYCSGALSQSCHLKLISGLRCFLLSAFWLLQSTLIVQLSAVLAFGQWLVLWVLKSVAAVAPVIHFPLQRTATLCKWLWFASGMSRFVYWGCLRWTVDSWNRISTTYTTLSLIIETFESSDFARFWAALLDLNLQCTLQCFKGLLGLTVCFDHLVSSWQRVSLRNDHSAGLEKCANTAREGSYIHIYYI